MTTKAPPVGPTTPICAPSLSPPTANSTCNPTYVPSLSPTFISTFNPIFLSKFSLTAVQPPVARLVSRVCSAGFSVMSSFSVSCVPSYASSMSPTSPSFVPKIPPTGMPPFASPTVPIYTPTIPPMFTSTAFLRTTCRRVNRIPPQLHHLSVPQCPQKCYRFHLARCQLISPLRLTSSTVTDCRWWWPQLPSPCTTWRSIGCNCAACRCRRSPWAAASASCCCMPAV